MTTQDLNQIREDGGKFGHALERMCVCGRPKGDHDAVRPFPICEGFECSGFKAKKKK